MFEQVEVNVGRTSDNDLVLHDHGVSRRHARIVERGGQYFVMDMGSSNGTALNEARLTGEQQLRDGDRIGVGSVVFTFVWVPPDGDEDATRPIRRNLPTPPPADEMMELLPTGQMPALAPVRPADSPPPPLPKPPPPMLAQVPVLAPVPAPVPAAGAAPEVHEDATRPIRRNPPPPAPPPYEEEERTELRLNVPVPGFTPADSPLAPPPYEEEERTELRLNAPVPGFTPADSPLAPLSAPPPYEEEERTEIRLNGPVPGLAPAASPLAPPPVPVARVPAGAAVAPKVARDAPVPAVTGAAPEGLTAAERARRRRELARTGSGQLALWWGELSRGRRLALGLLMGLVVLGGLGAVGYVFVPRLTRGGAGGPEPVTLGLEVVPDSFGLGEGVQWERPDQKAFEFQFVTPTRAVALLHYQASGISKEEVAVVLNGVNLGWVPPDTTNSAERELEHILPALALKRDAVNSLVLDNVRNPPGSDTWRVWNLRLEVIPVPELSREELLTRARQYVVAGGRFYELKDVGAENLFKAWQQYRFAWITLEALDDKPDLYEDVRFQLGQLATELDHQCSRLMLDFQRSVQFRNARTARAALQEMSRRFPTAEHRCHNRALDLAHEHEL